LPLLHYFPREMYDLARFCSARLNIGVVNGKVP
jgi:hypothetical protein